MLVNLNTGYSSPQFQRKPNAMEMKRYTQSVSQGLKVLDKNLGIIVHNSTVPSTSGKNLGIGSLLSKAAQLAFIPFLAMNGFKTIQQEPDGIRSSYIASPYNPQALSKNIFMIPIERLATEEYGELVAEKDIKNIINDNYRRQEPNKVDYQNIAKNYDKVLTKAYTSLINNEKHYELKQEFENFKTKRAEELTPNAIYEILSKKNNNENWKTWSEDERNLYAKPDNKLLSKIQTKNKNKIDFYIFKQWLAEREIANANIRNNNLGIKVVGDSPVAWTPVEEWMNQDLFMDNWALGCPPDDFSSNGQRWGFAVLKPETIFNPDGSLGKGGELMRKRYEKMFESSTGGARIDHIIGLIDPYVYRSDLPKMGGENSTRLYSSPEHPVLGKYARTNDKQYFEILEKIVIPAAEKYGLSKEDIICEDLGTVTEPVRKVMRELGLSGIAITQYDYRGKNVPEKNIIMPGSHDNESFLEYTDKVFNNPRHLESKSHKLAEDTTVPYENWGHYKWEIATKKPKFIAASFAELFTSPAKKIQMFFTTFLGINKTYNRPGETEDCWTLRIPENYENLYWENVKKGTAPNLPEAIARAIRNKGCDFANKHQNLLATLDEFTQILKS